MRAIHAAGQVDVSVTPSGSTRREGPAQPTLIIRGDEAWTYEEWRAYRDKENEYGRRYMARIRSDSERHQALLAKQRAYLREWRLRNPEKVARHRARYN